MLKIEGAEKTLFLSSILYYTAIYFFDYQYLICFFISKTASRVGMTLVFHIFRNEFAIEEIIIFTRR